MSPDELPPVTISLQPNFGGPEAIDFFRQLGICVAIWAYIDRRLYQIFHHAVGAEQKQSAVFYYGDRTFGRRLQLVDRALKAELPTDEFANAWKPIREETKTLSHTRNILVHQPVHRIGTSKDGQPFDIYSIYIEPYERILKAFFKEKDTIKADEIAARQLRALRPYSPPRAKKLRLFDVKQMFLAMRGSGVKRAKPSKI
jgi:hypothetical protein